MSMNIKKKKKNFYHAFLAIFLICHIVLIPSQCMEKCSDNILPNFSFFVPQKKVSHTSLQQHEDE